MPGRIGIWKFWFLRRGENRGTRKKTFPSKGENQQRTQPTYGATARIWTRATLVGGERSQYCTMPCSLQKAKPPPKIGKGCIGEGRNGGGGGGMGRLPATVRALCPRSEPRMPGSRCVSLDDLERTCFRVFQLQDRCRLRHEIGELSNGHSKMQSEFKQL